MMMRLHILRSFILLVACSLGALEGSAQETEASSTGTTLEQLITEQTDAPTSDTASLLPPGSVLYWESEFARLNAISDRSEREERRFLLTHWRLDRATEGMHHANELKRRASTYEFPPLAWIDAWRALFLFRLGRLEKAADLVERLHQADETELLPEAQLAMGIILSSSGQGRAAVAWLARAGVMKEFEEEALIRLILEYRALKEFRQEAYYRTLLRNREYDVWPAVLLERDNLDARVDVPGSITNRTTRIKAPKNFEYARINMQWVKLEPYGGAVPDYARHLHWSRRLKFDNKPGEANIPAVRVTLAPSDSISVEAESGDTELVALGDRTVKGLVLLDSIGTPELRLKHSAAYQLMGYDMPTTAPPVRIIAPNLVAQLEGPKGNLTLKAVEGRSEHIPLETVAGEPVIGIWGMQAFAPMTVMLEPGRPDGLLIEAEHLYYDIEREEPIFNTNAVPMVRIAEHTPPIRHFALVDSLVSEPTLYFGAGTAPNVNRGISFDLFDMEWGKSAPFISVDGSAQEANWLPSDKSVGTDIGIRLDLATLYERAAALTWDWDRSVLVMRPKRY